MPRTESVLVPPSGASPLSWREARRWARRARPMRVASSVFCMISLVVVPGSAFAEDASTLSAQREAMQHWLETSELSGDFSFVGLHRTSRRDTPDKSWLALEVRWEGRSSEGGGPIAGLKTRWQAFQAAHHRGLGETLFYKLLQVTAVDRSEAVVRLFAGDRTLLVFEDPKAHRLVVADELERQVRTQFAFQQPADDSADVLVRGTGAAARVLKILKAYLTKVSKANRAPMFKGERAEEDYAGMTVEAIKGCARPEGKFWEQLEINVELRPDKGGRRSVIYVAGRQGGGGLGSNPPGEYREEIPDKALDDLSLKLREALEEATARR